MRKEYECFWYPLHKPMVAHLIAYTGPDLTPADSECTAFGAYCGWSTHDYWIGNRKDGQVLTYLQEAEEKGVPICLACQAQQTFGECTPHDNFLKIGSEVECPSCKKQAYCFYYSEYDIAGNFLFILFCPHCKYGEEMEDRTYSVRCETLEAGKKRKIVSWQHPISEQVVVDKIAYRICPYCNQPHRIMGR
ncbi:MAG: hypothetical protein ABIE68_03535 [bacterium]